jgi:chromosome partitioning protein
VRQSLNPDLSLAGFLLTLFDARTRLSREVVEEMRRHFPEDTYETVIPRAVRLAEAPSHGLPAVLYDPVSSGTLAYQLWAAEFRARIERGANTANPPPAPVHP